MDEATREMIAKEITDIWTPFGLVLVLIFQWFSAVTSYPQAVTRFPRFAKFLLWFSGIAASVYALTSSLMNEIFGSPNPLYPWMRIVILLVYLAVWGYIIKHRSEIRPPKMPTSQ